MSTTFAIKKYLPARTVKVAHRHSKGKGLLGLTWLTKKDYPDNTKVFPLDNTAQGVQTIGDLKRIALTGKL